MTVEGRRDNFELDRRLHERADCDIEARIELSDRLAIKNGEKVYVTEVVLRPYDGEINHAARQQEGTGSSCAEGQGVAEGGAAVRPAVVIALCLFGVAFIAASMGAEWWLTRQVVAMAEADQANAKAEQDTFRQALLKMPNLVVDDPVMVATGRASTPLAKQVR